MRVRNGRFAEIILGRIEGTVFHNTPHNIGSSVRIHHRMRDHEIATLISAFRPSFRLPGTTMPSADFCLLTRHVSIQGAAGFIMRRWLVCVSNRDSYPPDSKQICLVLLVTRLNLFRILLMILLPHGNQISQDKNVSFPCTTDAFTLPLEPAGFVVLCQLAQELSLICGFCSSARTFAIGLPSDLLTETPLPSARTFVSIYSYEHHRFSYRGLPPHKLTLMLGVHNQIEATGNSLYDFLWRLVAHAPHCCRYR